MFRIVPTLVVLLLLAPAGPVPADEGRRMLGEAEAIAYRGVGRLNVAGARFCTATLIEPRLVLTAAHCLYHPRTRRRVALSEFRFVAGLRLGGFAAVRRVRRAALPDDYVFHGEADLRTVRADLALLELDAPIGAAEAAPFAVGGRLARGGEAAVVSYARDRAHAPSIHAACPVRGLSRAVAALDCAVEFGASGAPVLTADAAGQRVAAVVSAKGRGPGGRSVALTVVAEAERLEALRARLSPWPAGRLRKPRDLVFAPPPPPRPDPRLAHLKAERALPN